MKLNKKSQNTGCLWDAYNENDINKFRKLINSGSDLNELGTNGYSLIVHILRDYYQVDKNIKFFDELINDDFDFKSNIDQNFLLSIALDNPSRKAIHYIKKLLKYNININSFGVLMPFTSDAANDIQNIKKYSPPIFQSIAMSCINKRFYVYDLILEKNPDLEICDERGQTVINCLIYFHNIEYIISCDFYSLISKMIKQGADPSQRSYKDGSNSLHQLSGSEKTSSSYTKLFDLFLENGCGINSVDFNGITPLIDAAYYENPLAAKILIDKGADINISSSKGRTAIIYAAAKDNINSFDILFDNNAVLTDISIDGDNILHYMLGCKSYNEYFYTKILSKNPELLSIKNKKGKTPIDMIHKIKDEKIKSTLLSLLD